MLAMLNLHKAANKKPPLYMNKFTEKSKHVHNKSWLLYAYTPILVYKYTQEVAFND